MTLEKVAELGRLPPVTLFTVLSTWLRKNAPMNEVSGEKMQAYESCGVKA